MYVNYLILSPEELMSRAAAREGTVISIRFFIGLFSFLLAKVKIDFEYATCGTII